MRGHGETGDCGPSVEAKDYIECICQSPRKMALICVIHRKKPLNFLKNFFLSLWRLMWRTPGVNSLQKFWLRHKPSMDTRHPGIPAAPGTTMVPPDSPPALDQHFLRPFPPHLHRQDRVPEAVAAVHQVVAVAAVDGNRSAMNTGCIFLCAPLLGQKGWTGIRSCVFECFWPSICLE